MTPIIFLFLSVVKTRSYHLNPTWKGEKKSNHRSRQAGREGHGRESRQGGEEGNMIRYGGGAGLKPWGPAERMETGHLRR